MASVVKAILFDLGGVLLPFDRKRRISALVEGLGVTPEAARAFMALEIHRDLDRGAASETDLAGALSELAGRPVGADDASALILSVFEPPNRALWDLAELLRERFVVGGFSDNPAFVERVFPPGARLQPMVWSSELGLTKPSPEAFQAVQDRLGLPPEAILLIDDSLANVDRARRMGWDGIVFVSNDQLVADLAARGIV